MFSLCILGSGASFPHAQVGKLYSLPSVVYVSFLGCFVAQDGLLFSPCCNLCLLIHFGDCCNSLGSHFLGLSCNSRLIACVQWLVSGLCWEQGWGLGLLDKPGVFGNYIDRARELAFFSTTTEYHSKGSQGLRD